MQKWWRLRCVVAKFTQKSTRSGVIFHFRTWVSYLTLLPTPSPTRENFLMQDFPTTLYSLTTVVSCRLLLNLRKYSDDLVWLLPLLFASSAPENKIGGRTMFLLVSYQGLYSCSHGGTGIKALFIKGSDLTFLRQLWLWMKRIRLNEKYGLPRK